MDRLFSEERTRCDRMEACPVVSACGQEGRVPCLDMRIAHQTKLRLCETLENIADNLPAVDRLLCLQIASELTPVLRDCHRYEEDVVFPAFLRGNAEHPSSAASVRRLQVEHVEDECAAQDLTDLLLAIGHGGAVENPEALGFMLRAFFHALRRHVAFEHEHILPFAAAVLDDKACCEACGGGDGGCGSC